MFDFLGIYIEIALSPSFSCTHTDTAWSVVAIKSNAGWRETRKAPNHHPLSLPHRKTTHHRALHPSQNGSKHDVSIRDGQPHPRHARRRPRREWMVRVRRRKDQGAPTVGRSVFFRVRESQTLLHLSLPSAHAPRPPPPWPPRQLPGPKVRVWGAERGWRGGGRGGGASPRAPSTSPGTRLPCRPLAPGSRSVGRAVEPAAVCGCRSTRARRGRRSSLTGATKQLPCRWLIEAAIFLLNCGNTTGFLFLW